MMKKAVSGSVKSIQELHKRTLEIIECERKKEEERLETGIIYLPTWLKDRRGSPNSFLRSALFAAIQSKDRRYFEKAEVFSQQGIIVTYTGRQLNQEDLTVWLALVDLMKKDPLGTECKFTAHEILKYIGLEIGGSGYERLNDAILRMIACAVVIKKGSKTYMGSLIGGCDIDEYTKVYRLDLNRHLVKLFGDNDWTAINWEQRKQLRNKPLCLKLHSRPDDRIALHDPRARRRTGLDAHHVERGDGEARPAEVHDQDRACAGGKIRRSLRPRHPRNRHATVGRRAARGAFARGPAPSHPDRLAQRHSILNFLPTFTEAPLNAGILAFL